MPFASSSSSSSSRLSPQPGTARSLDAAQLVLREARRLHRAAASASPSVALPVLRRLLASGAVPDMRLPELFRTRDSVQRKHVLRMLALEAGHASWEAYSRALPGMDLHTLQATLGVHRSSATLKLWFSTEAQAQAHVAAHGGQALRVAQQAVVLPVAG